MQIEKDIKVQVESRFFFVQIEIRESKSAEKKIAEGGGVKNP